MNDSKFPKLIDYQALKEQVGDEEASSADNYAAQYKPEDNALNFEAAVADKKPGLHGSRLRSYAFAVLTRKEYSKAELIEKLALYAESRNEVIALVDELAAQHYQSDQRVAEIMLSSQKRKGKGPNQIKMKLKSKKIDTALIAEELKETDWVDQAYQLKVKKYGFEVSKDPKMKAKQIRFLMYRGFEMDAIIKAISRKESDDE
ncbi:regulatory protein RecX [Acinetobacter sp. ANC 3813]|uniref:regulatory protein RecX n=1 Tax=Acinetobacter sp. ANC 3813 TaxID=1977873 RepID=UPI000A32FE53|nr:regulatory protein RecX [Acinetobacter sp. ANC 3813]OTG91528.1 RecX family transcriptional regulator [Acinetobacter sp. ANC 3813]